MQPYPKYKDSGVAWLGEIPHKWEIKSLRTILKYRNEKNNPIKTKQILSLSIAHGITLYSHKGRGGNKSKEDLTSYKVAYSGDIVLNSMNVIVGAVGLSRYKGAISPVYYAFYPIKEDINRYYYEKIFKNLMFQRYLIIYGKGILIKKSKSGKLNTIRMKISPYDLKSTLLPLPTPKEQNQIASYLDVQADKITKFIKAKQQLIKLLQEQKQVIINEAVTKGINPNVKLKDSGVDWLGEIPEHWGVKRLRTISTIRSSGVDKKTNDNEIDVILCNYVDVYKNDYITSNIAFMKATATKEEIKNFELKKNDVIITKDSESWLDIAIPSFVPQTILGVVCAYHLTLIRPFLTKVEGEFLSIALSSDYVANQLRICANGVTRFGLTVGAIKDAVFPVPPLEEQREIICHIKNIRNKINAIILKTKKEITLIEEYRNRLIADVVTGKVDVRSVTVPKIKATSTELEQEYN